LWGGEADRPIGSRGGKAEHQMARDPGGTAHADMVGAEFVLEKCIGPLDGGVDAVGHRSGIDLAGGATGGAGVPAPRLLPTRVGIDDPDRAETSANCAKAPRV